MSTWVKDIKNNADPNVLLFVIGNKCDLEAERVVRTEQGEELAEELKCPFLEVSAK